MASSSARPRNVVAEVKAGRRGGSPSRPKRRGGSAWESVRAFAGTVILFLLLRTFFIEAFRIPSGSMIPALLVGDWLFVNKLVYGPHIPFTDVNLPGYAEPKRGEVVVFASPYQADEAQVGNDPTPTLVKRLVGVPGDTVHMRDALLYVNGVPQPQGFGADRNPKGDPNEYSPLMDWQREHALPASRFGAAPAQPTHDNWGPLVVPARRFFMLGDNRYNSKDSRYWGLVPRENLRGRPLFVYYSYDPESGKPLPFVTSVRWGRIGHLIR